MQARRPDPRPKSQYEPRREDCSFLYGWGLAFNGVKQLHSNVVTASAGQNHYIFVTPKNECFGVGSNRFKQLGLPDNATNVSEPIEVFAEVPKISQVACGAEHTFLLTTKNEVYCCGLNIKGQLGLGTFDNCPKPKLVTSLLPHGEKNAKASNKELMRKPKPAIYGILQKFQIQVREQEGDFLSSTLLLGPDEAIEQISCGALHTIAMSNKGRLFASGFLNQTKSGEDYSLRAEFCEVKFTDRKVKAISSGLSACGILVDGVAYLWGRLGRLNYNIPTPVKFPEGAKQDYFIVDVRVGDAFAVLLNSKGEVFTMGENLQGQLSGTELFCDSPTKVTKLPLVKAVSVGRNYCLAVSSEDNSVYGWGANQHGQITMGVHQTLMFSSPTPVGLSIKDSDRFVLGSFQTLLLKADRMEDRREEPREIRQDKEETISLKEYKKLQYEFQMLKNLNLSLISKMEKPPTAEVSAQTSSKFEVSGISKHRTFNSNLEIEWKELQLEKNISEGGYGVIYRAKWRESTVAVKKFKIESGDVGVRDFLSECHAMEAVRHPNIVMFLGACTKAPNYAIVLEFCVKGSLWSLLQNPDIPLPWDERRRIAIEIARAVLYLHLCNPPILHRDLKSLNILLDENMHVKIADFGWTKTLDKYMTTKIGTYQWMAPEVIGSPNYSEKADVFSYSIILWEIASREPPYKNINGQQVSQEVLNQDLRPTIPKKTPEAFARLTKRCWERDPEKRPNFREIIKELEAMKFQ